jgi:hypothetical protein
MFLLSKFAYVVFLLAYPSLVYTYKPVGKKYTKSIILFDSAKATVLKANSRKLGHGCDFQINKILLRAETS